ncbi:unnamed protein product [Meloidogyne enterolobii]|uniref:Uncharacterized protein n=1 Tax=Meloidogyne enterolobii TaxID=390850 RepID=A0ACB0YJH3_MELEN
MKVYASNESPCLRASKGIEPTWGALKTSCFGKAMTGCVSCGGGSLGCLLCP